MNSRHKDTPPLLGQIQCAFASPIYRFESISRGQWLHQKAVDNLSRRGLDLEWQAEGLVYLNEDESCVSMSNIATGDSAVLTVRPGLVSSVVAHRLKSVLLFNRR